MKIKKPIFLCLFISLSVMLPAQNLKLLPKESVQLHFFSNQKSAEFLRSDDPISVEVFCPSLCHNIKWGAQIGAAITNNTEMTQLVSAEFISSEQWFAYNNIGQAPLSDDGSSISGEITLEPGQTVLVAVQLGLNVGEHDLQINITQGNETILSSDCSTEIRNNFTTDISIEKEADNPTPTVGDIITYTLTVTNNGDEPSETRDVFEFIPPGLELIDMECEGETITASTGMGCFSDEPLAPGESYTIKVTTRVLVPGEIINQASTNTCSCDENLEDNFTQESIIVEEAPLEADLKLLKSASRNSGEVGRNSGYKILVINCGEATAQGIQLVDTVPSSMKISNNGASTEFKNKTNQSGGSCTVNGQAIHCDLRDMEKGDTILVSYLVDYIAPDSNALNKAIVSSSTPDPDLINNSAIHEAVIFGFGDLSITKAFSRDIIDINDSILVTLKVFNHGPDPVKGIEVLDQIDTCFEFLSGDTILCKYTDGVFRCTGSLEPGEQAQHNFYVKAKSLGNKYNTATVTHAGFDHNPENDISTDSIRIIDDRADVSIRKTMWPSEFVETEKAFNYRLIISNNGPQTATNIKVLDTFSTRNVSIMSVPDECMIQDKVITCEIESLESGEERILEIPAMTIIKENFTNYAEITSSEPRDPNLSNNQASVRTLVIGAAETVTNFPESGFALDPVSTIDGSMIHDEPIGIFEIPFSINYKQKSSGDLKIVAFGTNIAPLLGQNWRHNYDHFLYKSNQVVLITLANGEEIYFKEDPNQENVFKSSDEESGHLLIKNPNNGFFNFVNGKNGESIIFNGSGLPIIIESKDGQTINLEYDSQTNLLSRVTSGQTQFLEFEYDENNYLVSVKDGTNALQIGYEANKVKKLNIVPDFQNLDGPLNTIEYTYQPNTSYLTSKKLNGETLFENTYNEKGQVVTQKVGEEVSSITIEGNEATMSGEQASDYKHIYDELNRLVSIIYSDQTLGITYTEASKQITSGEVKTTYEFDPNHHQIIKLTLPGGEEVMIEYEQFSKSGVQVNLPVRFTSKDEDWVVDRDDQGRVTRLTNGRTQTWRFDYSDDEIHSTDPLGNKATYDISTLELKEFTLPDESTSLFSGNEVMLPDGNLLQIKLEGPVYDGVTTFQNNDYEVKLGFDKIGRAESLKNSNEDDVFSSLRIERDVLDNITRIDFNGIIGKATYNALNQLESFTDHEGNVVKYTWNGKNHLASRSTSEGESHSWSYNSQGKLIEYIGPEFVNYLFNYSAEGEFQSLQIGNDLLELSNDGLNYRYTLFDQTICYVFGGDGIISIKDVDDDLEERALKIYRDEPGTFHLEDVEGVERNYEESNNQIVSTTITGETITMHQSLGRIDQIETPLGNIDFLYNSWGNLASIKYPDGEEITFGFDDQNRLVNTLGYDVIYGDNRFISNGIANILNGFEVSEIQYPLGFSLTKTTGLNPSNVQYEDNEGNLTTIQQDAGKNMMIYPNGATEMIEYNQNRVTQMSTVWDGSTLKEVLAYGPDGKLLGINSEGYRPFIPDLGTTNRTFSNGLGDHNQYDQLGNVSQSPNAEFDFDLSGLLRTIKEGETKVEIDYDAFGRPVKIINGDDIYEFSWNYGPEEPLLGVEKLNGEVIKANVFDEQGAILYTWYYPTSEIYTYHADAAGNVRIVLDGDQNSVAEYTYSPYGITQVQENNQLPFRNWFTHKGKQGMIHLMKQYFLGLDSRVYDASQQAYLQVQDDQPFMPNYNSYSICNQNPIIPKYTMDKRGALDAQAIMTEMIQQEVTTVSDRICKDKTFLNSFYGEQVFTNPMEEIVVQDNMDNQSGAEIFGTILNVDQVRAGIQKLKRANDKLSARKRYIRNGKAAIRGVTILQSFRKNLDKAFENYQCSEELNYKNYLLQRLAALENYKNGVLTYYQFLETLDEITENYAYFFDWSGHYLMNEILINVIESQLEAFSILGPLPEQASLKKLIFLTLFGQSTFIAE